MPDEKANALWPPSELRASVRHYVEWDCRYGHNRTHPTHPLPGGYRSTPGGSVERRRPFAGLSSCRRGWRGSEPSCSLSFWPVGELRHETQRDADPLVTADVRCLVVNLYCAKACARSAMRSSASSMPHASRIMLSGIPHACRSSGDAW